MTATQRGPWAGAAASGAPVRLTVLIHFPWDAEACKFSGERIYFDRAELPPPADTEDLAALHERRERRIGQD